MFKFRQEIGFTMENGKKEGVWNTSLFYSPFNLIDRLTTCHINVSLYLVINLFSLSLLCADLTRLCCFKISYSLFILTSAELTH